MSTEYGSGGVLTVTMDGPFASAGSTANKITQIYAAADSWKGGESPFSQVVTVEGVSVNSKVDIQMSAEHLEQLQNQEILFTAANDGGVVTLYAIGEKPNLDCEFQATITEVTA